MKRLLSGIAPAIFLILLSAFPAGADVHFNVKNCTDHDVFFRTYNGEDFVRSDPHQKFSLRPADPGESDAKSHRAACTIGCAWLQSCNKHCQLAISLYSASYTDAFKVSKNHHVRIIEAKYATAKPTHKHPTLIKFTMSDKEESCHAPARKVYGLGNWDTLADPQPDSEECIRNARKVVGTRPGTYTDHCIHKKKN